MLYGKYQFTCRLDDEAMLTLYKGSTFRGVFGHALKRVVCALKRQACETCILKERCLYVRVFETPLALSVPPGSRVSVPPHPFVIEAPEREQTDFKKGEALECRLLLFGEVNNNLPHFVYAFEQMGKIGIGKRVNGSRGRFVLQEVTTGNKTVYSDTDRKLNLSVPVKELTLSDAAGLSPGRRMAAGDEKGRELKIRVRLETPLRLKFENEIQADLPFHVLARGMLRRMSSLCNTWGQGEPELDYKGLIDKAKDVRVTENSLRWFDWRRYSNRQERKMFMGGMLGSVAYGGKLGDFFPLLEFCEKVHLGKNTSFGLGKIAVDFGLNDNREKEKEVV